MLYLPWTGSRITSYSPIGGGKSQCERMTAKMRDYTYKLTKHEGGEYVSVWVHRWFDLHFILTFYIILSIYDKNTFEESLSMF